MIGHAGLPASPITGCERQVRRICMGCEAETSLVEIASQNGFARLPQVARSDRPQPQVAAGRSCR
jgi:hypothetical protein